MSRVLLHLSDLHFGRVHAGMAEALIHVAYEIAPNLVVVSGDLTQRARPEEFQQARAFLDSLAFPRVVVPGNHDVPLYNLYGRFVNGLERFRAYISEDLEPAYIDSEVAVFGVNTARSLTWKGGRINQRQIESLRAKLCGLPPELTRIVVTHHPFDLPEGVHRRNLVGSARTAFERWARCGTDLILCGHLHIGDVMTTLRRYGPSHRHAIVINAGTAISSRGRGELNSFNVIHIASRVNVTIIRWRWNAEARTFLKVAEAHFEETTTGWRRLPHPSP